MHVVGIVGRVYYNKDEQEIIQTHDAVRRYIDSKDDMVAITILPTEDYYHDITDGTDKLNYEKINYVLDKCDAFIVPGGTYAYNLDQYVIEYAIKNDKPLLAICLGFQVMCSMFAKKRTKFDMTERIGGIHHGKADEYAHSIEIEKDTLLYSIIGKKRIEVNSVHNDVVKFEMNNLVINARADDIIEGVEYPNKSFILGVQWHPEYINDNNSKLILDKFVNVINQKSHN